MRKLSTSFLRFLMVVSVHIPKTGGTSFSSILSAVYQQNLWVNYDQQWSRADIRKGDIPYHVECVHGHFEYDAFDTVFSDISKITWTRDPIERTLSLYQYILKNPDINNKTTFYVYEKQLLLEEFIELPWVQNQSMNYLKDSQPYDFHFVGFLDTFQKSLEKCAEVLNWAFTPEMAWVNKNNNPTTILSQSLKKKIYKLNEREYDWISSAKSIFSQ